MNAEENVVKAFASLPVPYVEPSAAGTLTDTLQKIIKSDADVSARLFQSQVVAAEAIKRLGELENALIPFAVTGVAMLNIRRLLMAEGRLGEAPGGVWFQNGPRGDADLAPAGKQFDNAIDAYGRERVKNQVLRDMLALENTRSLPRG